MHIIIITEINYRNYCCFLKRISAYFIAIRDTLHTNVLFLLIFLILISINLINYYLRIFFLFFVSFFFIINLEILI